MFNRMMEECRSFEEVGLDEAAVELDGAAVVGSCGIVTEGHDGTAEGLFPWVEVGGRSSDGGNEDWILSLLFLVEMWTALIEPAA